MIIGNKLVSISNSLYSWEIITFLFSLPSRHGGFAKLFVFEAINKTKHWLSLRPFSIFKCALSKKNINTNNYYCAIQQSAVQIHLTACSLSLLKIIFLTRDPVCKNESSLLCIKCLIAKYFSTCSIYLVCYFLWFGQGTQQIHWTSCFVLVPTLY